jgi:hypothetical protein
MTFDEAAAKGLIQPPQAATVRAAASTTEQPSAQETAARTPVPVPESAASATEQPAAQEADARVEVRPPEARAEVATNEAVMPPENPLPNIPTTRTPRPVTEGLQANAGASLVILPSVLQKAEENLAAHLATRMDPALTEGLILTLSSAPVRGMTDVKLCLDGPMVAANASLVGQQALAALRDVSAIAPYFNNASKPHAQKPEGAAFGSMVHVHIPQLTTAQYAALIQSLAQGIATGQSSSVRRDTQADVAEAALPIAAPAVSQDAAVAESKPEALKEVATPAQQIVQPVAHEGLVAAAPTLSKQA